MLNRHSKLKIYKTIIKPVVTYGCETWTMSSRDEANLRIFERKILRKIYGRMQDGNDGWKIKIMNEL